ncbi:hypothetical protein PRIPAC_81209 [Pristionchus pacificus]|uniref:G protein-coupled receptor n=1 Tax=Pristionchus pacificus TaxID=54126 RepID=A0A2A6CLN7_PRIPA|nr:hypothetical protein PRIPAC_81209 [Pristionchus pacificus]|eukprot:PDM79155.1 G protein-coupled receptor [Pristionchus pacificus]
MSIDVLFEPIPLFPAYAGYCAGFLCEFGVPLQYSLATAIVLLANVGVSIVVCCLYRHQTVLLSNSIFKLRRFSPDISWIKTRGTYIMYERTASIVSIFVLLFGVIVGAMISVISMLAHVVYTLKIQMGIPIMLLIIPGLLMLIGLIFEVIPFEVCLVAYFMLPLHPIGHNIILLAVTPAYRSYIGHLIKGGACGMVRFDVRMNRSCTPEEMFSRRMSVLTQLMTCVVHSLVFSVAQTVPLVPHKSLISTSPFRELDCFPATFLFLFWISNLAMSTYSALASSISHYLGLMEGMKQFNFILAAYDSLPRWLKNVITFFAHAISVLIIGLSIFVSMDLETASDGPCASYLRGKFALIRMKSGNTYLILLFFNRAVWQQLEMIKPSISPRTWDILHYTSRLFLAIAVQPILSFFIPIASYMIFQFIATDVIVRSVIILNVITWTISGPLILFPFIFYLLTLASFKVYRYHFLLLLRAPFTRLSACRVRKIENSVKDEA